MYILTSSYNPSHIAMSLPVCLPPSMLFRHVLAYHRPLASYLAVSNVAFPSTTGFLHENRHLDFGKVRAKRSLARQGSPQLSWSSHLIPLNPFGLNIACRLHKTVKEVKKKKIRGYVI